MRGRFGVPLFAGLLLAAGMAFGQAAAAKPEFEVASIRPSAPLDMPKMMADMAAGKMPRIGPHVDASRAEYTYMTLKDLLTTAYKVKDYQITGPDWLGTQRFDIVATLPQGATKDDAPLCLQALLADRFKVALHRDTQDHPVLALVVGKDGPKLKESPTSNPPIDPDAPLQKGEIKMDTEEGPVRMTTHADGSMTMNMGAKGITTVRMDGQSLHMESTTTTMAAFADSLTQLLQMGGGSSKPVVDMTGLKGNYQISLDISMAEILAIARSQAAVLGVSAPQAPASGTGAAAPAEASDPGGGGSSVFKSVEAMGLKLDSRKMPVEQLIIDHAEKTPTEN